MRLSIGPGDFDKIAVAEAVGLGENRSGDGDFLVASELADCLNGRLPDRRQGRTQLNERLGLDPLNEVNKHVIEHADLLFIEAVRVIEEKIGNAPESLYAFFRGASLNRIFEFGDQGRCRTHSDFPHWRRSQPVARQSCINSFTLRKLGTPVSSIRQWATVSAAVFAGRGGTSC
jgi:hypothetical protein